jgi:uncharacterized membrane protein YsdA (DUF1294 family)
MQKRHIESGLGNRLLATDKSNYMTRHRPKLLFLTLAAVSVIGLSFLLTHFLEMRFLYAYLIGINLTTFLMYGSDKQRAVYNRSRIPEIVLPLLALAGGSAAALLAHITLRQKTRKRPFRIILILILLVQLVIIASMVSSSQVLDFKLLSSVAR